MKSENAQKCLTGIEEIAKERDRQINDEGWTEKHDDTHTAGELASAGAAYAAYAAKKPGHAAMLWPWNGKNGGGYSVPNGYKPELDTIRNLVKAGALIAAEIDRIKRGNTTA